MASRHILITGASSGIGAALARHYASPETRLDLGGRDLKRLEEVAVSSRAQGAAVVPKAVAVTDRSAMREWILAADADAPLDLVIANAGIGADEGFSRGSETLARPVFEVNVDGVLNTVYPAMERMVERGRGQIAFMSSLAGYRGFPDAPAYSASKAAVKALAEAWRGALASRGIRVSVICPGFIETPMTARNKFRMPFLITADRAAGIIARGLDRNQARISFPWQMTLGSWLVAAVPALGDRVLRPPRAKAGAGS
ncbi:MAG TPA: SDR family NAD(P)-dependent oxidoreductase [Stellaceae bacterium]|nr:SDR family NAD(P)-dependent oxidoreductase [Stellaceae bacterium]